MKKIKKDLVSKKKPIETRKVENKKAGKVQDLAPKAKNLASNLKNLSKSNPRKRKPGEITRMEINPNLKKK